MHMTYRAVRTLLVAVVIVGLAVDAWVHLSLASNYDGMRSTLLSEGDLFRTEGAAAILSAALLLARPRRYVAALALVVAAGGLAAVLVYTYVDVGAFGPFPDMYEPAWYAKKSQSAWGEGAAAFSAMTLVVLSLLPVGRSAQRLAPIVRSTRKHHE